MLTKTNQRLIFVLCLLTVIHVLVVIHMKTDISFSIKNGLHIQVESKNWKSATG